MVRKISSVLKENLLFCILFVFMGGYYIYRMFFMSPWYDELYTYLQFINKGFFYSATHWPLPNNHVFFSMISSIFNVFGNGYIGLRGVSFISALATLILLYTFLKKCVGKNISLISCCLYVILVSVNSIAIQGRGYSFATFMLMLSIVNGYAIACEEPTRRNYILWAVSLWLGLYTLVSSVYWVMAVCICYGILLLLKKEKSKLLRLFISSLVAAALTAISYGILWCYMGAEIIQQQLNYNESLFRTIIRHPKGSLLNGIYTMLGNQYVQGIDRKEFFLQFKYYFRVLFRSFTTIEFLYSHVVLFVISLGLLVAFILMIRKNKDNKVLILLLHGSVGIWMCFIVLAIQSAYPYLRVLMFLGIYFAIMAADLLAGIKCLVSKRISIKHPAIICIPVMVICFYTLFTPFENSFYSDTDHFGLEAIKTVDWSSNHTYLAETEYFTQQLEFYGINHSLELKEDLTNPDVIILSCDENNSGWPFLVMPETIQAIDFSQYELTCENGYCKIYTRK